MRILVVEDTDDSRVLLNDYLEAVGFDVLSAKDGESAYKLLEVSSVDLVVTDILMPKMDGYELCRRIKSSSAIPNIPVIFYTATYTDKRDQELAYRLGASRFLVKPFDLDALLYEINAVLKEEVPSLDDLEERNDIAQIYAQTISEKLGKKVQELDDKKKDADKLTRRIEAINDSLPSLIWELDSELKMLYANRTTQTWFGVEIIQILGQRVTDLFDSSESETILGIYQRFLKGETELCEVELQVGGSRKRVQVQGIPSRDRSGNVLGVYSIITDVTDKHHAELEQRQLEQRLQRGQKLELIGQFTGGIAHDFNNILTIVAGYTGMAMHHLQNSSDDTLKDYIKEIHSARLRGTDIVTHLLAFCRGGESQRVNLKLSDSLAAISKLLKPAIHSSIVIEVDTRGCEKVILHINPVQLDQVILNLCLNAKDAMGNSGRLQISATVVDTINSSSCSSCHQPIEGEFVDIQIQDNGSGMDEEVMMQIFEPFYTTKMNNKGTGLGLAMTHSIIHENQGHIVVESKKGKGTCFHVLLPLANTTVNPSENKKALEPELE